MELYVGTLPVGGVVAGGEAGGTTPYLLRSPESDGACAAAADTSGSLVIGVTASANATNAAVHARARRRALDLPLRSAVGPAFDARMKLGIMRWC